MRGDGRSPRTVRWLVVALYVNVLLWSVPYQRVLRDTLLSAGWSRWWLGAGGVVFGAAVIVIAARLRPVCGAAGPGSLVVGILAYAALVWYLSPVPEEVIHLAQYGGLALLGWWALEPTTGARAPSLALVLAGAVGFVDESVQHVTPGRFFDWRDVIANLASAVLPVWVFGGIGWRRREQST